MRTLAPLAARIRRATNPHRGSRPRRLTALVAALAVAAGACGGGDSTTTADADPPEAEGTTAAGSSSTDAESDSGGAAGGTLNYGAFSDIPSFDPHATQGFQSTYIQVPYDTLTAQDAEGNVVPNLATEWEATAPTTWQFTLRDDVAFTDGSPFDAEVVKANLERGKAAAGNPNAATFATIEKVTVVDEFTVDVTFALPEPGFPLDMSLVQGAMISGKAIADGTDLTRNPQGSGGWVWDAEASQDGAVQVFTKNPDYWNPEAQLVDEVRIHTFQDNNARINALESGEIHIMEATNSGRIADLEANYDISMINNDLHFFMITDRAGELVPALGEEKVREAIALALDREAYTASVHNGVGETTGGLFSSDSEWFSEDLADYRPSDLDRARELLAEAGYPDGFSMQIPTAPVVQVQADAVAQLLSQVGIEVEVITVQAGQQGPLVRKGEYPGTWLPHRNTTPASLWKIWISGNGPFNPFDLTDTAEIDALAVKAAGATGDEQKALYDEMQKKILDANFFYPLAHVPVTVTLDRSVEGFTQWIGSMSGPPQGVSVGG